MLNTPLEKLFDLNFYSADIWNENLLNSDKKGRLQFFNLSNKKLQSEIKEDHFPKNVLFYPHGNEIFTTTDEIRGLRVWDTKQKINIYQYKQERLLHHKYNKLGQLSVITETGIKIYDLRITFEINYINYRNCTQMEWKDNKLYISTKNNINIYDNRKLSTVVENVNIKEEIKIKKESKDKKILYTTHNNYIKDITFSEDLIFLTDRINIYDRVELQSNGNKILRLDENILNILVYGGNTIEHIQYNINNKTIVEIEDIKHIIYKDKIYLFGDDGFFIM